MKANKIYRCLLSLTAIVVSLGIVPQAFAVDPAHLVQEGNANCSDYGNNKTIHGIDDSSLTYSPDSETINDGTVQVTYSIDEATQVLTFYDAQYLATGEPAGINVAIVRGDQNKAETYMWGTDEGVTRWPPFIGSSVDVVVTPPQTTIENVVFCYGLGLGEEIIPTIPSCETGEFPGLTCQDGDEFLSSISGGESTYCCCPPADTTGLDTYCDPEEGLRGCVLGSGDPSTGCGSDTGFSDIDDDVVGAGSPTRVCKNTSSGYVCYYER
jgi:hypothetical protein